MTANWLNVQITPSSTTVEETVRSPGRVTWRNRCQAVAPSISAASYSSAGIDWRPPSSEIIMNGTPTQVLTRTAAAFWASGSSSQPGSGRCSAESRPLTAPPSASISRQEKTVTKVGTAQGRMSSIR